MTDTPHRGMPLIAASQSQKHVTHNQAIVILDSIVMLSVIDSTHTRRRPGRRPRATATRSRRARPAPGQSGTSMSRSTPMASG